MLFCSAQVKNRVGLGSAVMKAIYQTDGVLGFYRGFWASAAVYIPQMLTFWPSYYALQDLFNKVRLVICH